ncbi:MAG: hypothetical protein MUE46_00215 [Xanthomonadales bacterium]|jgi:uncharacterized protein (TIGR02646 family)|nr:hypothetical protein [Xanthomonadales bacterium]
MLPLAQGTPSAPTLLTLTHLQTRVAASGDFAAQVAEGKRLWNSKTGTKAGQSAFADVRTTLARMCTGPRRCHYCEDSQADEIEHVRPKDLFPGQVFDWNNYLYACGPCNGPKSNRHGVVRGTQVEEIRRPPRASPAPPPNLPDALIDPRREDPRHFLELDLGGEANGLQVDGTFEFLPLPGLGETATARAAFTIDVLGLNRQVLIDARFNAYSGYRARLREYLTERAMVNDLAALATLRDAILATPHLTVFDEMRRQSRFLPFMAQALAAAPEIASWSVTPAVQ